MCSIESCNNEKELPDKVSPNVLFYPAGEAAFLHTSTTELGSTVQWWENKFDCMSTYKTGLYIHISDINDALLRSMVWHH